MPSTQLPQGIPRTAIVEAVDPPSTRIRFDGGWFSLSRSRSTRSSSCMLYPDADADADDGPAETGPLDTADTDAGSDVAVLLFRRGPPGAFGSLT